MFRSSPGRFAIIALLLVPFSGATVLISDPPGDAQVFVTGSLAAPDYSRPDLDILELAVSESELDLEVAVVFAAEAEMQAREVRIELVFGGAHYRLTMVDGDRQYAELLSFDVSPLPHVLDLDVEGDRMSVILPKELLVDANGAAGRVGTVLEVLGGHAKSRETTRGNGGPLGYVADYVVGNSSFELRLGNAPSRGVALGTDFPVRVSNGAATVYAFNLSIDNLEPLEQIVRLEARRVPQMWSVSFPLPTIHLAPHETRALPVLVAVPFNHVHGQVQSFEVVATNADDTVYSEQTLAVRYTEIPQPAGHHPRMWFHASADGPNPHGPLYFNTLPEDPLDESLAAPAGCFPSAFQSVYTWRARFGAPISIGLDFDLAQPVEIEFPLQTAWPVGDAEIRAFMLLQGYEFARAVNHTSLDAEGVHTISLNLELDSGADLIPPAPNRVMELFLEVETGSDPQAYRCHAEPPAILPGGELVMPLFEYHDPLEVQGSINIELEPIPTRVAPGSMLWANLTLDGVGVIETRAFGHNSDWISLGETVYDEARDETMIAVRLMVPQDAAGAKLDSIVEIRRGIEAGLARLSMVVDDQATRVVEGHVGAGARESSGVSSTIFLFLLVAVLVAHRRY